MTSAWLDAAGDWPAGVTLRTRHHAIWLVIVIAAVVTVALLILVDLAPIRTRPRRRP